MTFSVVACAQEYGTAVTSYDHVTGKISASVTLRCDYANREALVADLLSNGREWPFVASLSPPIALKATIRDAPGAYPTVGQLITPYQSLVDVQYGVPEFKIGGVGAFDLVAESIEPAAEFQTLDYRQFRWTSTTGDPLKKGEEPGKLHVKVMLVRRIFKVPIPFSGLVLSAIGKCNLASYASPLLGITFPAETLLYLEPSIERTLGSSGANAVNYTQKWMYNPNGWNKYWRADTETWEEIYSVRREDGSDPYKSYVPTDLSALLL